MPEDYSAFRPSRIWKRMMPERRLEAARFFWTDENSTEQQVEAISAIAAHMKFRAKTLVSLPLDRKAKYLVSLPPCRIRSRRARSSTITWNGSGP
jgi:hypothetical protein